MYKRNFSKSKQTGIINESGRVETNPRFIYVHGDCVLATAADDDDGNDALITYFHQHAGFYRDYKEHLNTIKIGVYIRLTIRRKNERL